MENNTLNKLFKNSWIIFLFFIIVLMLFLKNTLAETSISWYWSDSDYSSPTEVDTLSWTILVWSWETETGTTLATVTSAVELSNGWASVVIPTWTQIADSNWATFNVQSITTNVLTSLPLAISNDLQETWKINFWISWVKLNFSKPIKLQIPVNTTNSTVKIYVKHAWSSSYQTYALTDTLASNCSNWYATPSSNIATVSNWIATIYTCSASSFVAVINKPSSWWGWGWSFLTKDYCPNWDYSRSFYDKDCWTKTDIKKSNQTPNISEKVNKVLTKDKLTKRVMFYKWVRVLIIDWYDLSDKVTIATKKVIDNKGLSLENKKDIVNKINIFLLKKYTLDTAIDDKKELRNDFIRSANILRNTLINLLRRKW